MGDNGWEGGGREALIHCETINIGPLVATLTESDIHLRVMFKYTNVYISADSVRVEGNNVQRVSSNG